jgi:hypothetical protein
VFIQNLIARSGKQIFTVSKISKQHNFWCSLHQCRALQVALIDEQLQMLVDSHVFKLPSAIDLSKYVQPASIDLPVSGKIFLVKEKVLPFQQRVSDLVHEITLEEKSLDGNGAVLLKGQVNHPHKPIHRRSVKRCEFRPTKLTEI